MSAIVEAQREAVKLDEERLNPLVQTAVAENNFDTLSYYSHFLLTAGKEDLNEAVESWEIDPISFVDEMGGANCHVLSERMKVDFDGDGVADDYQIHGTRLDIYDSIGGPKHDQGHAVVTFTSSISGRDYLADVGFSFPVAIEIPKQEGSEHMTVYQGPEKRVEVQRLPDQGVTIQIYKGERPIKSFGLNGAVGAEERNVILRELMRHRRIVKIDNHNHQGQRIGRVAVNLASGTVFGGNGEWQFMFKEGDNGWMDRAVAGKMGECVEIDPEDLVGRLALVKENRGRLWSIIDPEVQQLRPPWEV